MILYVTAASNGFMLTFFSRFMVEFFHEYAEWTICNAYTIEERIFWLRFVHKTWKRLAKTEAGTMRQLPWPGCRRGADNGKRSINTYS